MLIRILQTFVNGSGVTPIGCLLDVPEETAKTWIADGLAKAAPPAPKLERADRPPRNKALAPQAKPINE